MGAHFRRLGKHYLGFSKKINSDYTPRQLSAGAAFTVFAHGEIESYVEDCSLAIIERAELLWKSGKLSRPIACLLSFREAATISDQVPTKDIWSAPLVQAIQSHKNVIGSNNGIRERHICKMYIPVGFDVRNIDPILIADLTAISSIRGDHAHQSYGKHIGQQFDPFDRQVKVMNAYKLLADFDTQCVAYLNSIG